MQMVDTSRIFKYCGDAAIFEHDKVDGGHSVAVYDTQHFFWSRGSFMH
jgi:hypothetical protein